MSLMFQVRFHGRGGQGAVTAAEVLSVAAFFEGKRAQAFPSFGSERTGAPVVSFCRISESEIRTREPVLEPDALVVQDVTLMHQVEVFAGLLPEGYVLLNTRRDLATLGLSGLVDSRHLSRVATCPATELALEALGRPLPNAALLGGFAALTAQVSLDSVTEAIRQRFPGPVGEANARAAEAAYLFVARAPADLDA